MCYQHSLPEALIEKGCDRVNHLSYIEDAVWIVISGEINERGKHEASS